MHCRNGINVDGVVGWCRSPRSPWARKGTEGRGNLGEASGSETVTCGTVFPRWLDLLKTK
jgi:hypothetical protein